MNNSERIRFLIDTLNHWTKSYDEGNPEVSDIEWDNNYFELKQLEEKTGLIFVDSPTQQIEYQVVNGLEKVEHNHKMLSLDKTKNLDEIKQFLGRKPYIAMLKMDGLTCSLTYEKGQLIRAETRGNGIVGENILHNALVITNIPKNIPYQERIVIDGEIICNNNNFATFKTEYKNSRNFAAGSIRLLDSKECFKRKLSFIVWDVIEGLDQFTQLSLKLDYISREWNFTVVPFRSRSYGEKVVEDCKELKSFAEQVGYPIDGLVFKFDDIAYGKSLGETSHHFKNAMAYKFYDETAWTNLIDIEWNVGRTGVLTPVAVFKPVELDGSTIERASLHNLSIIREIFGKQGPYINQEIEVFKSNAIIPQVKFASIANIIPTESIIHTPSTCPICGASTEIVCDNNSDFLYCTNPDCNGKLINQLTHFCGKKGLDIKGLSEATLQKLIDWGWVTNRASILFLECHRNEWIKKPGFGEKSVDNILKAIDMAKQCDLSAYISSLGIPLVGTTISKELAKHFKTWQAFREAVINKFHFWDLPNFGFELHSAISKFNYEEADYMVNTYLSIKEVQKEENNDSKLLGKAFVITGKLISFKNRNELKTKIEASGGKVVNAISSKTDYLINNDINSTSSKNQAAKKLNIPILSEEEFVKLFDIN